MSDTPDQLPDVVRPMRRLTAVAEGIGDSLAVWVGESHWADAHPLFRESQGHAAVSRLDELLAELTKVRQAVAEVLGAAGSATDAAGAVDGPSAEDLAAMRDETFGNLDWDVTDAELRVVWQDLQLRGSAAQWGWSDTVVREELCDALERRRGTRSE